MVQLVRFVDNSLPRRVGFLPQTHTPSLYLEFAMRWFLLLALIPSVLLADDGRFDRAYSATCRVERCCSGIVYSSDKEYLYVLTAAHCIYRPEGLPPSNLPNYGLPAPSPLPPPAPGDVGKPIKTVRLKEVTLEFFNEELPYAVRGEVIWWVYEQPSFDKSKDLAIIKVAKSAFNKHPLPAVILLANPKTSYEGKAVITCGCAMGHWPAGYKAKVVPFITDFSDNGRLTNDTPNGAVINFLPEPVGGQSGSGVVTDDAKHVVGIIVWRDFSTHLGVAIPVSRIYELAGWKHADRDTK